jgi:hypothetical protein
MTTGAPKVRENLARRMAERQGLVIHKSGRRDPRAIDFEKWSIDDGYQEPRFIYTLDEIEAILRGEKSWR